MEKVDEKGNVIGFSILKISALKTEKPLSVSLSKISQTPIFQYLSIILYSVSLFATGLPSFLATCTNSSTLLL